MIGRWVTLSAVDSDKAACAVYAANFPGVDVQCCRVENATLPTADVILAGFPCQPHSFAGERKASADERDGGDAFVEAIDRVRPRMFLGENVAGILSSEDGRYIARLVSRMEALGYRVQVKALDAVDFGVPQFRNRVWFWGIRNDVEAVHRWPTRTHMDPAKRGALFGEDLPPWVSCGDALGLCVYDMQNEKNIGDDRPCGTLQGTAQEKGGDAGHYAIHRMSGPNSEEAKYGDHPCTEPCPTVSIPSGGKCGLAIRRARGESVDRPDHPTTEPCPTIGDGSGGSGGVLRVVGQVSHADDARPIDAPASTLRAGGKGHDSCCVRIVGDGTNPRGSGGERTTRDITDEPSPTIPVAAGNAISEYRYSEAMYAKHAPAAPAAPAPTVQAKWYKGGAEGLVMAPSADGRPWDSRHPVASPPAPAIRARSPRDGGRCTENVVVVQGTYLPAFTIFGEPVKWIRKGEDWMRRLSPLECARLQSVPDDFVWPEKVSKSARYLVIGNGVACGIAAHLSRALAEADPKSRTVLDLFCGGGLWACGWHGRAWTAEAIRKAVRA